MLCEFVGKVINALKRAEPETHNRSSGDVCSATLANATTSHPRRRQLHRHGGGSKSAASQELRSPLLDGDDGDVPDVGRDVCKNTLLVDTQPMSHR